MPPTLPFKLFKEPAHWWSGNDYKAVLDAMAKTGAKTVLEFGPGSSTLALIEGGATSIETCEDQPDWAEVYEERLVKRFPEIVKLHRFEWPEGKALNIPALGKRRFDLALIDGPRNTPRRPDVVRFAMARANWVLVPVEEHQTRAFLRPIVKELAEKAGRAVEFKLTGPLAGAFALLAPPSALPAAAPEPSKAEAWPPLPKPLPPPPPPPQKPTVPSLGTASKGESSKGQGGKKG